MIKELANMIFFRSLVKWPMLASNEVTMCYSTILSCVSPSILIPFFEKPVKGTGHYFETLSVGSLPGTDHS